MTWLFDILRAMIFWIDKAIFGLIPTIYNFIIYLASMNIFDNDQIKNFAANIYSLLGILMVFKLAFSLLGAIVNPDNLTDEKKGFGKIIQRCVIGLVLIVVIPMGFNYAMRFQGVIVNNSIIQKLIIGKNGGAGAGETISAYALKPFVTCNGCNADENESWDSYFNGTPQGLQYISDHLNDKVDGKDEYKYNYIPLISTITGGFILYILIIFCFDIARRSVKLGFLELLTPVAVVSFATSTASENIFTRWLKAFGSTYASLFIRIVAITFIAYMTSLLAPLHDTLLNQEKVINPTNPDYIKVNIAMIFILFGILVFGKQAPQFISELFGIKSDFELDIRKVLGNIPIAGGAMLAAGGLATGGVAKLGAGLGSGIGGAIHSAPGNRMSGFGKGLKAGAAQVGWRGKPGQQFGAMLGASKKANADLIKAGNAAKEKERYIERGNNLKDKQTKFENKQKGGKQIFSQKLMDIKAAKDAAKGNYIASQNKFAQIQTDHQAKLTTAQANLQSKLNNTQISDADKIQANNDYETYRKNLAVEYDKAAKDQADAQTKYEARSKDMEEYLAAPANSKDAERYNAVKYVNDRDGITTKREERKAAREARKASRRGSNGGTP